MSDLSKCPKCGRIGWFFGKHVDGGRWFMCDWHGGFRALPEPPAREESK